MASLGQELKRERELRGISLQEIADSTRISLKFLQAVEGDQLQIIPGPFFIRAILRSYAKSIGLDENQVLNRYQELQSYAEGDSESGVEKSADSRLPRSRRRMFFPLLLVAIFVIAALLYVFILSPDNKPEPPPLSRQEPASGSPAPAVEAEEKEPAQEIPRSLNLEISFLEETWLQVFADGTLVFEGIKKQGDSLQISGSQELRLNLGNAGGLNFLINGKKGKPFGPRGAVLKDIKITLDNYGEFLLPEAENQTSGL
ncbi:MAG: helix-turn-helix domain-containing protein [Candidatus Aminicenantes bacterium]|nr:helix-turn-helix domain-containing protein [Candidatus Aminicenantes bacterium]